MIGDTAHVESLQVEDPDAPGSYMDATFVAQFTAQAVECTYPALANTGAGWRVLSQPTGFTTPVLTPQSGVCIP